MSEAKLARRRVRSDKVDRLRAWYEELQRREPEVIETLEHEGVYAETAFLSADDDGTYLYLYLAAADVEAALAAGEKEKFEIDERHHEVLADCLAGDWEDLEAIGHFTNLPG